MSRNASKVTRFAIKSRPPPRLASSRSASPGGYAAEQAIKRMAGRSRRTCAPNTKYGSAPRHNSSRTKSRILALPSGSLESGNVHCFTEATKPVCCRAARSCPEVCESLLAIPAVNINRGSVSFDLINPVRTRPLFSFRYWGQKSLRCRRPGKKRNWKRWTWRHLIYRQRMHDSGRNHHEQLILCLLQRTALEQFSQDRYVTDPGDLGKLFGHAIIHEARDREALPVLQIHFRGHPPGGKRRNRKSRNRECIREIQSTDFGRYLQMYRAIGHNRWSEVQLHTEFFELNADGRKRASSRTLHDGIRELSAGQETGFFSGHCQNIRLSQNLQNIVRLESLNCRADVHTRIVKKDIQQIAEAKRSARGRRRPGAGGGCTRRSPAAQCSDLPLNDGRRKLLRGDLAERAAAGEQQIHSKLL